MKEYLTPTINRIVLKENALAASTYTDGVLRDPETFTDGKKDPFDDNGGF